jgi:hypothetical protein
MNTQQMWEIASRFEDILKNLASSMKWNPVVLSAEYRLENPHFMSDNVIEMSIDVELCNGKAVTWQLTIITEDDVVEMEPSILVLDEAGQHPLTILPKRWALTYNQAREALFDILMQAKELDLCASKVGGTITSDNQTLKEVVMTPGFSLREAEATTTRVVFVLKAATSDRRLRSRRRHRPEHRIRHHDAGVLSLYTPNSGMVQCHIC